jgi:hypothetical protein
VKAVLDALNVSATDENVQKVSRLVGSYDSSRSAILDYIYGRLLEANDFTSRPIAIERHRG